MERSNSCPTCRAEIPSDSAVQGLGQHAIFQNQPFAGNAPANDHDNQRRPAQALNNQREELPFEAEHEFEEFRRAMIPDEIPANDVQRERRDSASEEKKEDQTNQSQLEILQKNALLLEEQIDLHRKSLKLLEKQYHTVIRLQQALIAKGSSL